MNIVLTGSRGFIGSYFNAKYNTKYNIKIFSFLDDNIEELILSGVESIIHLSALVHQMGGATKEEYEKINVKQTIELAKKAKESGVKHFIFMSTVKVYGEESDSVYTEITICTPEDEYGKSKLKAEKELEKLKDENFKVSIIRTPIVYGEGVKANIKKLISLVSKVSILPFTNINNRRSMIYIGNLCHLIDTILEKQSNGIFLASDDKPISTTQLIKTIAKELDKKIYLVKIPLFKEILKLFQPSLYKRLYESLEIDNSKTKKLLDFENLYSAEDGIKLMINGTR